jgi:hypothetical protein
MNAKILVCIPCLNRKAIVEQCVPTVRAGLEPQDSLRCYNDGSTEYDTCWLGQFCTDTKGEFKTIGIDAQRREHFIAFAHGERDWTHLYLTDADAIHDPSWRSEALRLQSKYNQAPLCLYDTTAHSRLPGNTIEDDPASEVIWRRVAPGISYLLTAEHVAKVVAALPHLPPVWHFDWTVPVILGNRFAVSRVGYCDHIGLGGLRHPVNEGPDGGDRATSPTPWLIEKRREIIEALSK